jgi:hypothetical protein
MPALITNIIINVKPHVGRQQRGPTSNAWQRQPRWLYVEGDNEAPSVRT